MNAKKAMVILVVAIMVIVLLFVLNSQFDSFKDPADFEEYSDS